MIGLDEAPTALLPARIVPSRDDPAMIIERAWEDLFDRDLAAGRQLAEDFGGTVTLRPSRSESGARKLVDLLPEVPKAPGSSTPPARTATGTAGLRPTTVL